MTPLIDANGSPLATDKWQAYEDLAAIKEDYAVVPISLWRALDETGRKQLLSQSPHLGLEIPGDQPWEDDKDLLVGISLLVIVLSSFRDGRAYSLIHRLHQQLDYKGEVRVTGDFLADQTYFFKRCGVDSFVVSEEDLAELQELLTPFTYSYQDGADHPTTIATHRRRDST